VRDRDVARQVDWSALLQTGVQLEPWQRAKLEETVKAMSYQLGSSSMPWLQARVLPMSHHHTCNYHRAHRQMLSATPMWEPQTRASTLLQLHSCTCSIVLRCSPTTTSQRAWGFMRLLHTSTICLQDADDFMANTRVLKRLLASNNVRSEAQRLRSRGFRNWFRTHGLRALRDDQEISWPLATQLKARLPSCPPDASSACTKMSKDMPYNQSSLCHQLPNVGLPSRR